MCKLIHSGLLIQSLGILKHIQIDKFRIEGFNSLKEVKKVNFNIDHLVIDINENKKYVSIFNNLMIYARSS